MKPDVLVIGKLTPPVMQVLEANYALHRLYEADEPGAFLGEVGQRIRAIATSNFFAVPAELIDRLPNLGMISSIGVGVDAHAVAHARARGVQFANTPDVLNDDVANLAIALLLMTTRRMAEYDRYVRDGRWATEGDPPLSRGIAGKQIGIVGMGRIGQDIAAKLGAFGCERAYYARNERPEVDYRYYPALVDLAHDSAALIVIVPGGKSTEKLIDRPVLDALGRDGILINVARGSVVDEPALISALQEGRLGGAGLDVFADEPNVPAALLAMDQVVLQPHQGSATVETRRAMGELMLANLAAYFEGKPLPTPLY